MKSETSRRHFLARSVWGLTVLPSLNTALGCHANDRLRLAVFGTMYNAHHFLTAAHIHNAEVVVLCEPDQRRIPDVQKKWGQLADKLARSTETKDQQTSRQYRRMAKGGVVSIESDIRNVLNGGGCRIDALVVSHYDHLHGVACGAAMRAGLPVLSERPLGASIRDARALRALAARTKAITTYRSPGTGTGPFRRAIELVDEGVIGEVKEVHVWFRRGGPDRGSAPQRTQRVPDGLSWDLWLGPLPYRDYHADWMAYAHWRETCSGGLGSFGPHTTIFPFMTLKLRELWNTPNGIIRVCAECSRLNPVSFPRWERVHWDVPARHGMPAVTVTWHHGPDYAPGSRNLIHARLKKFGISSADSADALMGMAGSMLVGTKGALVANDHSTAVTALPKDRFSGVDTASPRRSSPSRGIYRDWIDGCCGKPAPILASFDVGGPLSELLMLGNIATLFPGRPLTYSPVIGKITNHEPANARLGVTYRDGWRI